MLTFYLQCFDILLHHHAAETIVCIFLKYVSDNRIKVAAGLRTMAGTSGCGTASNLWYSSLYSGPMLIYAPLFSVESQYRGAEKTVFCQIRSRQLDYRADSHLTCDTAAVVLYFITLHAHLVTSN